MYNGGTYMINKQVYFEYAVESYVRANAEMKIRAVFFSTLSVIFQQHAMSA
jgi:hypothetical protein